MNKRLLVFLTVVLAISMMGLCSCKAPSPTSEEEGWQWPPTLTITTSHLGGGLHMVASSWGGLLGEQTGMKVRALAQANMPTSSAWVKTGIADFYTPADMDLAEEIETIGAWATRDHGAWQMRCV